MDNARVENILGQIARALDEAHRRGIVHRDLKPENVLLATIADGRGQQDVVKVVDFGIARRPKGSAEEQTLTVTGALMGTPAYMAPEQFTAEKVDGRADVYALALIGYQMLTGRLPWRANSVIDWAEAHRAQPPAPLRSLPGCEHFPKRYEDAIQRALAKSPDARTASTLAFVEALVGKETARAFNPTMEIAVPSAPMIPPSAPADLPTGRLPPASSFPPDATSSSMAPRKPGTPPWVVAAVITVGLLCLALGYWITRGIVR
jgi:serine/threonine-protein kinase